MTEIAVRDTKRLADRAWRYVRDGMIAAFVVVLAICLSCFTRREGMQRRRI
jgi:hypothetical protein